MSGGVMVERVELDRYGRTLAMVYAGGVNLSCRQLERRQAIYKPRWDNGGRVASSCPQAGVPGRITASQPDAARIPPR